MTLTELINKILLKINYVKRRLSGLLILKIKY